MREILFRGKRVDNGEWVYGVPIQCYDGDWQICTDCSKLTVTPETVGQYTGLTDKNGVKIFEGDIVKFPYVDPIFHMRWNNSDFENGIIKFKSGLFFVNSCDRNYPLCSFTDDVEIEVIGNIYDNLELIKSEVEK